MIHIKYKKKKGRREGRGGEVEGMEIRENGENKKGREEEKGQEEGQEA